MVEVDYVVPPEITITYEGDLDLKELYTLVKSWLSNNGFFLSEKEHSGTELSFKSKWEAFKKVDDYTKYMIKVGLSASNLKAISNKNKNLYNGEFSVTLESYLEKDYEDKWEINLFLKYFADFIIKL